MIERANSRRNPYFLMRRAGARNLQRLEEARDERATDVRTVGKLEAELRARSGLTGQHSRARLREIGQQLRRLSDNRLRRRLVEMRCVQQLEHLGGTPSREGALKRVAREMARTI